MIERKITIGLITSTEYCKRILPVLNISLLQSGAAKLLVRWCVDYYEEYGEAPKKQIENIYYFKLKAGEIQKDLAEELEELILPGLSQEYENEGVNVDFLFDESLKYLNVRTLEDITATISSLVNSNAIEEAKSLISSYMPLENNVKNHIDLSKKENLKRVKSALSKINKSVFSYPGVLGNLLNPQLIRGGFIAFMASEKRGKSYWLLDMAIRASRQKQKVAFFQAGDMTEDQQLKRIAVYLTGKADKEIRESKIFIPVKDCVKNQLNTCIKNEKECPFGVFMPEDWDEKSLRTKLTKQDIIDVLELEKDYVPCHNCKEYQKNKWGNVWLKQVKSPDKMSVNEALRAIKKFFIDYKRQFRLSSHVNGTLSVKTIEAELIQWEKEDGYVPDLIIIDYADILVSNTKMEFRHQQNDIWKSLRGLSQKKSWLVVTVTQADAKSYEQSRLKLSNFSEDKRKYAHVTAMFGLNQDPKGRDKKLGVMWINEMLVREGEGDINNEVAVLQNLKVGKPFLTSFI